VESPNDAQEDTSSNSIKGDTNVVADHTTVEKAALTDTASKETGAPFDESGEVVVEDAEDTVIY
jgi:hypothetical protein